MAPADLLTQYGYLALFIGCLLEGETLLVLAGVAAHGGYLWLPTVVAVAFIGGTLGDQILFYFGRRSGGTILQRWPRFQRPAARVQWLVADLALFERAALTIAVMVAVVLFILHRRRHRPGD